MKRKLTFSHKIPCVDGKIALSPDAQFFATKTSESLCIFCFSTLECQNIVPAPYTLECLKFSLDGKYVGWLSLDPCILRLCEILTKDVLEIDVKPGLEVVAVIFGPNCVIYISELEVYLGVYDFETHKSFTLEGCSLDDFDRPLLQFSPKGDYLCFVRGHQIVIYNTVSWNLVTIFSCPVFPTILIFVNAYTIFMANGDGVIEWFSAFGSKLKSESISPSCCIVAVELSKDGRNLVAATHGNRVLYFDTISMESSLLLEYVFKAWCDVDVFSLTNTIIKSPDDDAPERFKYTVSNGIVLKEVKNLLDEFKLKTQNKHLMSLHQNGTVLATVNPMEPFVIWVWDMLKTGKPRALIRLHKLSGSVKALRWEKRTNRLAVSCSNVVVIWSDKEDLVVLPGERMPVGIIASDKNCRFACF